MNVKNRLILFEGCKSPSIFKTNTTMQKSQIERYESYVASSTRKGISRRLAITTYFILELNKELGEKAYFNQRKNFIIRSGVNMFQLSNELEQLNIESKYFNRGELVDNYIELLDGAARNDVGEIYTIADALFGGAVENTIGDIKRKIFANTTVGLDMQQQTIAYYVAQLTPLHNANMQLLSTTPNQRVNELTPFQQAMFNDNDKKIKEITKQLEPYIGAKAIQANAALLGAHLVELGDIVNEEGISSKDAIELIKESVGLSANTAALRQELGGLAEGIIDKLDPSKLNEGKLNDAFGNAEDAEYQDVDENDDLAEIKIGDIKSLKKLKPNSNLLYNL